MKEENEEERRRKLRRKEDEQREIAVKEVVHPNPAMRPARRIWVAILFLCVCIAIAASYAGLQAWTASIQRGACDRANDVRRESNSRIFSHVQDEENLLALLAITTETRAIESSVWNNLNSLIIKSTPKKQLKTPTFIRYENDVKSLIDAYRHAHDVDASIRAKERKVHFDKLIITNCKKVI